MKRSGRMTKGVYVLEVRWTWDNSNTEYGTRTIEEPEIGFDNILNCSPREREKMLFEIYELARGLDRSIMGKATLVRFYRVVWEDGYRWPRKSVASDGTVTLRMRMKPICDFDELGKPVPVDTMELASL